MSNLKPHFDEYYFKRLRYCNRNSMVAISAFLRWFSLQEIPQPLLQRGFPLLILL